MENADDRFSINDFARRSFRDMADEDYIMARLALRNRLIPQFIWASQQAIEKYLKAMLLFHRSPCKLSNHDLMPLLEQSRSIPGLGWVPSKDLRCFVKYLDIHNPIRYLEGGYHARGKMLLGLDDAIWDIRRFCMPPERNSQTDRSEPAPPSPSDKFDLFGGELERIAASKDHPARLALVWKNLRSGYGARKHVKLADWHTGVNAPTLDLKLYSLLEPLVFFPNQVKKRFKAP